LHIVPALAQTERKGSVLNTAHLPVAYAHVVVLNTSLRAVADTEGLFQLMLSEGTYSISVSAIGYATQVKTIICTSTSCPLDFSITESTTTLDEVVVTSDGTEKNILETAVSVSVIGSTKVTETQTWQLEDLQGLVPNLVYADLGVPYQQQISMRGVSVFSETPATATYVDGVSAFDVAGNNMLLTDIERIEVLRGPQGTLYGRNALAGVINIITKKPGDKTSGFAETSFGNQGLQRYGFAIKTPIVSKKLFVGVAAQYQMRNGYYTNDLTGQTSFDGKPLEGTNEDGKRMGDQQAVYGSFNLRYFPNARWELLLNVKGQTDQSIGASMYYQSAATPEKAINDPYKISVNDLGSDSRDVFNSSFTVKSYHENVQVVATSAFSKVKQKYDHIDQDLTQFDVAYGASAGNGVLGRSYPMDVYSQEIRVKSTSLKKLQWTIGTYGFYQRYDKQFATVYKRLGILFGTDPGTYVYDNLQDNAGAALFGELNYSITSKFTIAAGMRGDYENRQSNLSARYTDTLGTTTIFQPIKAKQQSYHAVSPKFVLSYKFNDNQYMYLSYARGFRAGGINGATSYGEYEYYKPEYSDNIEAGYKMISTNKKINFTGAAYFLHWTDLQLDFRTPGENGVWVVGNIGNVQSLGVELETSIKLLKGFQADVALGLNHSHYQDFDYLGENIKGNRTILAPSFTTFTGLQYQVLVVKEKSISGVIRAEWRGTGKQYFDLHNTIEQPTYNLFNVYFGIQHPAFSIMLWSQNISGTTYITYALPGYFKNTLINRPRTFGLTLNYKF
jgi:iron complex outermembrane receptor protein